MGATKTFGVRPERDAYGQEIWNCYKGNSTYEVVERDDGLIDLGTAQPYFREFDHWATAEREAITRARGRVLDVGAGAGRVALYLQPRGHEVLSIDNSPLAVKVAKLRGAKQARVLDARKIGTLRGPSDTTLFDNALFDTIVMYGNNFGLFGGMSQGRRMLAAMHRITSAEAKIIGSATDPYQTDDPLHREYQRRNRRRGRMSGQLRLRIRYRQYCGEWFDYLLASIEEVEKMVKGTGWKIGEVVQQPGPGYVVILVKA